MKLGGEKIDIIEYSDDPAKYIANALSPAKIMEVKILPKNKALAVVPNDQLSLAIGKDGQNVRLAAKLTGWKIDVRSPENLDEALEQIAQEEAAEAAEAQAKGIEETEISKKIKSETAAEKPWKKPRCRALDSSYQKTMCTTRPCQIGI